MIDLLVRNGVVVTAQATFPADIAVRGDKILAVGAWGSFGDAALEVDAQGKFVLPGLVDPHLHMAHPFKDQVSDDGVYSTSVSAAFGGTTTLIDFAIQWDKNKTIPEIIQQRRAQIEAETVVDFGLHATPTKSTVDTIQSVVPAAELGVPSYKVYMIYRSQGRMVDDAVLYGLLEEMKHKHGRLMVHAENASIAEFKQQLFLEEGHTSSEYFPLFKPNIVEAEAVNRAIYFTHITGSRLYIAHLSTREALHLLKNAQSAGDDILAETCPHYLVLTDQVYRRRDGHNFICSPPLRSQEDVEALWQGIADGSLAVISSDHCGFGLQQKNYGQGNFSLTPNGLPGIETRLPLIYTEGVLKNRISLNRMVEVLSTNAARIFGLYPQKGEIQPGSDADLILMDGEQTRQITARQMHGNVDWTPYEGMVLKGFAVTTILRGKVIIQDENLMAEKGSGKYLPRKIE